MTLAEHVPVLLYDGDCGFCARSVRFVLARESPARRGALRFAPLQGAFGAHVRRVHPSLEGVESVIWYDPQHNETRVRSSAALAALRHVGGIWAVAAMVGSLVPPPIRDAVYDWIARNRHRLAGEACLVPTAEERARFLA